MPHVETVLQAGAETLAAKKGDKGDTGATGADGVASIRNERLVKVIVNLISSPPFFDITFEEILKKGDIWEDITSGQFTGDASRMRIEYAGFLNAANQTKKVKVLLGNEQSIFAGKDTLFQGRSHIRPEIARVDIDTVKVNFFHSIDPDVRRWIYYGQNRPSILPVIIRFNLYLIGEDS